MRIAVAYEPLRGKPGYCQLKLFSFHSRLLLRNRWQLLLLQYYITCHNGRLAPCANADSYLWVLLTPLIVRANYRRHIFQCTHFVIFVPRNCVGPTFKLRTSRRFMGMIIIVLECKPGLSGIVFAHHYGPRNGRHNLLL